MHREAKLRNTHAYHYGMYLCTEDARRLEEEGFPIVVDGVKRHAVLVLGKGVFDWKEARLVGGQYCSAQADYPHLHLLVPRVYMGHARLRQNYAERTDVEHYNLLQRARGCRTCAAYMIHLFRCITSCSGVYIIFSWYARYALPMSFCALVQGDCQG